MAQIRKRGTNVWQIGIYLGRDEEGKKCTHYETFYGNKTQAKEYSFDLEKQMKLKVGSSKSSVMFAEELFTKWLHDTKKRVEISTYEQYQRHVKKLTSLLGDLPLYTLDSVQVAERLMELDEELSKKGGLSARTIKNHYRTLVTAMNWGAVKKYVSRDAMHGIKPPKMSHKNRRVLRRDELNVFIENAKLLKWYLPIKILALTGMRVGELMGLKWINVSEDGTIRIVEAVNSKLRYLKDTKTQNSMRELKLDEDTERELQEWKKTMASQNKAGDDDFVFQRADGDGECITYDSIRDAKETILKNSKLQHIRLHDLRHGVGTLMLDAGASLTKVAEQLGQDPATTASTYSHKTKNGGNISELLKR